jgi:hypothetical protein
MPQGFILSAKGMLTGLAYSCLLLARKYPQIYSWFLFLFESLHPHQTGPPLTPNSFPPR